MQVDVAVTVRVTVRRVADAAAPDPAAATAAAHALVLAMLDHFSGRDCRTDDETHEMVGFVVAVAGEDAVSAPYPEDDEAGPAAATTPEEDASP